MKKIALILFMVFAAVQLAPAVKAIFTDITCVFITDEEKAQEKGISVDKKEKKYYPAFSFQSSNLTKNINTAFHLAEKIYSPPCLEKLTPPPNFC
jgi:hypothetical protein